MAVVESSARKKTSLGYKAAVAKSSSKGNQGGEYLDRAAAAARRNPKGESRRETSLEDKASAACDFGDQQPNRH